MDGVTIFVAASAGLNTIVLGAVLLQNYRIGKIEGVLSNGDYLRCPFYRGKAQLGTNCNPRKKRG